MNKCLIICFFLLSFGANAQVFPKEYVIDKDTCVCFSLPQTRQFILWDVEREECNELLNIQNDYILNRDSLVIAKDTKIITLKEIGLGYQQIIVEKNDLYSILNAENTELKREIRRQKLRKIFAWIGGSIGTGVFAYLYITK